VIAGDGWPVTAFDVDVELTERARRTRTSSRLGGVPGNEDGTALDTGKVLNALGEGLRQDIGGKSSQQSTIGAAEPERRIRRPARHLHEEQEQTSDEGERRCQNATWHEPVGARRKNRPDLVVRRS